MPVHRLMILGLAALAAVHTRAEERLPSLAPAGYTSEQRQAAEEFEALRKTPVFGPFEVLMHSPELMTRAAAMGDYIRYRSAIGRPLTELAILLTAREWSQDYEWYVHYPNALKAGIRPEVADAIADGRRPAALTGDEQAVYDYALEMLRNRQVADATFERAKSRFGTRGVVDLNGILGYYTFLAMQLNAAEYPIPPDGRKLPILPR